MIEQSRLVELIPRALEGLRGCGGAGFPTDFKWQAVRQEDGRAAGKVILCNADEAEPGTFKDAWLLRGSEARQVLIGMIHAGRFCGAERGFVYLRAEYSDQRAHLVGLMESMVEEGLLSPGSGRVCYGAGFPGRKIDAHHGGCDDLTLSSLAWHVGHGAYAFAPEGTAAPEGRALPQAEVPAIAPATQTGEPFLLEICVSGAAYICGEETALLESMEGRRPQPRHKPPFPTQSGLWGRPTLINNVETYWWAARLIGAADQGREAGSGHQAAEAAAGSRRLFSLSGAVCKPGVYEAEVGIRARDLIQDHGGGLVEGAEVSCWIPGGAATGILPPQALDTPLSPEGLAEAGTAMGTGGLVVYAQPTTPREVAGWIMRFFAQESCSQCTPCRQGCLAFADWLEGLRSWEDQTSRRDWLEAMEEGSICGLGFTAPATVRMLEAFGSS